MIFCAGWITSTPHKGKALSYRVVCTWYTCNAPTRQLHRTPFAVSGCGHTKKTNQLSRRCHPYARKSPHKVPNYSAQKRFLQDAVHPSRAQTPRPRAPQRPAAQGSSMEIERLVQQTTKRSVCLGRSPMMTTSIARLAQHARTRSQGYALASRLVRAMPARSANTRRAPSRHCRDARGLRSDDDGQE